MTYYADLTSYEYINAKAKKNILNIGWLEKDHIFIAGKIDGFLLETIFNFCKRAVNRTRGYHLCPFCSEPSFGFTVKINNERIVLGAAEIWVKGKDDIIYAAPDLIYHYINDHFYLPPEEFLKAVRGGEMVNPETLSE